MDGYVNKEGQGQQQAPEQSQEQGQKQEQEQEQSQGQEQGQGQNGSDIIYSQVIRAGKRTYFLDVKATRKNDYYLTITESKKRFKRNGKRFFEKHKVFLYKEDFDKFTENLEDVINFIKNAKSEEMNQEESKEESQDNEQQNQEEENSGYTSDVRFEDLDNKE
ncbi:MAG: PUR family DNA/RNA-binding protein [Bacteroidales bacterium]|nr:PUR family DNA/RNA-binding protein [Bacteroidales bacterium]